MTSRANKETAQAAYAAFSAGDAAEAMRNVSDEIVWNTRGHNVLTGTRRGREAVGELWGQLAQAGFRTTPREFIAEGDKVVVLTTVEFVGERDDSIDVLTYDGRGKLIAFDSFGDPAISDRVFGQSNRFRSADSPQQPAHH
jgi:ketosteroid isomerase-like protein